MTHCYNCGHTGTFVLLVEFAIAVPGPARIARDARPLDRYSRPGRRNRSRRGEDAPRRDRGRARRGRRDAAGPGDSHTANAPSGRDEPTSDEPPRDEFASRGLPTGDRLSLAVQCPACHSTDVGLAAADLLARYGSNATS